MGDRAWKWSKIRYCAGEQNVEDLSEFFKKNNDVKKSLIKHKKAHDSQNRRRVELMNFSTEKDCVSCNGVRIIDNHTLQCFSSYFCRWWVLYEFSGSQDCNGKLVAVHPHRLFILHSQPGSLPHRFPHGQHCSVRETLTSPTLSLWEDAHG